MELQRNQTDVYLPDNNDICRREMEKQIVVYPDRITYMFLYKHITHHHTGTNHKRPSRDIPFYAPLCT